MGFPEASVAELWGFALVVDEEVADAVGFTDAAYFSRQFKKEKGLSPLKYRKSKNNKG